MILNRKLTPEKKIIPPPLPGVEPATFRPRAGPGGGVLLLSYPRSRMMELVLGV